MTTSPLETLVDVFHHFDTPLNCLKTSRVVVEVRLEGALLSCRWPALNRLLEQRPERLLPWLQSEDRIIFVPETPVQADVWESSSYGIEDCHICHIYQT
ncbi:hypothetical protein T02_1633 [Trichinella nativa]|uniref:Uncharacterized protein n=1 Tax=Trichinella nativa TaxID=6335 RepID=A0A0V1KSC7_9BILA|nr:hypothetical protein T02_1633 [Trichinella nativa]